MLSREQWSILRWTAVHRGLAVGVLFLAAAAQSPFDSSAWIQLRLDATFTPVSTLCALPFLRWDSLHFLAMASPRPLPLPFSTFSDGEQPRQARGGGTEYEQSLAFQPGIIWVLKLLGSRGSALEWSPSQAVLLTSALAAVVSAFLPLLLFSLTKRVSGDDRFSRLAAYLSILSPSPSTLVTPTPEAFFAFFALLGHLSCSSFHRTRRLYQLWLAAVFYALATTFRANGVLLAGFLLWQLFWQRPWPPRLVTVAITPALVSLSVLPLFLSQAFAYSRFCLGDEGNRREWCDRGIASVYTFVQDHYWNVGLFRYWTVAQLPNWFLAAPVLGLASTWLWFYYRADLPEIVNMTLKPWRKSEDGRNSLNELAPHAHFALLTLLMLVCHSHIQIALRFASPGGLPAVWWGASQVLLHCKKKRGWQDRTWSDLLLAYLVVWNVASVALYAGFYPPA